MDKQLRIILTYQDQATAGLTGTISRMQGAIGGFQGIASKGFGALTGIVGGAIGGVKNFITGLADHMKWASFFIGTAATTIGASFVNMAAGLEQTRIGFETLLKDDAKVKDALGFIQKWALETPFSVTEATDSFKRFLAVTGDLQLTKKYLQSLGDAVVATGGNINEFNFAARAMTQIQAMSKVRAQEMYQLVNANIPAFDILAKAIQNGKLKVDGLNTSMSTTSGVSKKLTNEYQKASTGLGEMNDKLAIAKQRLIEAEGSSKTKQSTLMSLRNTVQNYEQSLTKANGTIDQYTAATKNSNKIVSVQKMSLDEIKGKLQDIGTLNISGAEAAKIFSEYFEQAYGGAAKRSTTSLKGAIGVLKDQIVFAAAALLGYNQITGETYGIYAKLKEAIGTVSKFLIDNKNAFTSLGKVLQSNTAIWAILGVAVGVFYGFLAGILAPVIIAGAAFGLLGVAVGSLGEKFGGWGNILQTVKGYWDTFSQALGLFMAQILPPLQQAFQQLQPQLQQLGAALIQILPYVITFTAIVLTLAGAILTGLITALAKILPNVIGIFTGVVQFITGILQLIGSLFTLNGDLFIQAWTNIGMGIWNVVSNFVLGVWNLISGFVEGIINFFKGLYNALVGGSIVPDIVNGIITWFTTLKDKGLSIITDLAGGIKDKFLKLAGEAINWGSNVIKNFVNGAIDAAKNAKKIGLGGLPNIGPVISELANMSHLQHGGIVPGMVGQAVPVMAHGGERIIPRGSNTNAPSGGDGGGITINMTGPVSMDSPQRVKELADTIIKILGRQNELSRFGVGFSFV